MNENLLNGWKYYNHAAVPAIAPHMEADTAPLDDGTIWDMRGGKPLLVRWTSDFDCRVETEWWYCIKDTPFDIKAVKAKRRYEITKGIRNYAVKLIDPQKFIDGLFVVQSEAFSAYPTGYRPVIKREFFEKQVRSWENYICYGAFDRESGDICGYALLEDFGDWISFQVLKVIPSCEKKGVNAALIAQIIEDLNPRLDGNCYICDGERNIMHQTHFQEYLEKYFCFRRAYCRMHIRYKKGVCFIVKGLYPFRNFISKFNGRAATKVKAVLFMEQIRRSFEN